MLTLYHYWDSFCSFKVRLCLEEKELAWRSENINLMMFENLTPRYLEVNPNGLVPALVHDNHTILESSIINEYLDGVFPDPKLRPTDELELARMRYWVGIEEQQLFKAIRPASLNLIMKRIFQRMTAQELDAHLARHPRQHLVGRLRRMFTEPVDQTAIDKSRQTLRATFQKMNEELARQPWLAGRTYSLADIAAAPVIDRVLSLQLSDLWQDLGALRDWVDRVSSRPAYRRALPRERMLDLLAESNGSPAPAGP
ncbi:MAG: glutathione S-transferase family protein [Hyphomicrobiales bacterium]|nr:glutathione S-transferase family protein [Hyphomicrobiales bacterium]